MSLKLTPLSSLRVSAYFIPSYALLPNISPHSHPLLIYYSAYPATTSPSTIESHLPGQNISPQWRYTMYNTTHYHSTTHEVLCVFRGRAKLLFGGEQNPERVEMVVGAGDAIVIPAGVGHRLVEDYGDGGGFQMVGSYPKGYNWDMCYGKEGEEKQAEACGKVKWFDKDPLYGDDGPVLWSKEKLESYQGGKVEL